MAVAGDIAAEAQSIIPRTWSALERATGYGDSFLKRHRDNVVYRLFGDADLQDAEEETLDPLVKEYAGKRLALSLCIPGADYWAEQPTSVSAGERENKAYANRAAELRELRKLLLAETKEMWPDVEPLIPGRKVKRGSAPLVQQAGGVGHTTPDPATFEEPYAIPTEATELLG